MTAKKVNFPTLVKLGGMTGGMNSEKLVLLAELEIRAEEVRQQEFANWITVAMNPAAFPFPREAINAKIKALTGVELPDSPELSA